MNKPFQSHVFYIKHLILTTRKNSHKEKFPCLCFLFINKCRSQSCLNHQMTLFKCTPQLKFYFKKDVCFLRFLNLKHELSFGRNSHIG